MSTNYQKLSFVFFASMLFASCAGDDNDNDNDTAKQGSDGADNHESDEVLGTDSEVSDAGSEEDTSACMPRWTDDDCTRCLLFVNGDAGSDDNTTADAGRSWESAFATVQKAIDEAASEGCAVWVAAAAAGYVEHLQLVDNVDLFGGFAGDETTLEQRDWRENETVLDGNAEGTVVTYESGGCNNSEPAGAEMNGFTITGGNATAGGGMLNVSSAPIISNCTFIDNTAGEGGAIYNDSSCPTVRDSSFIDNTANIGGAVSGDESVMALADSTFSNNVANYGGALVIKMDSRSTVKNCTFSSNSAETGGGIYVNYATASVTNCTFSDNQASVNGGAVENYYSSIDVTNCAFEENSAIGTGGAVDNNYSSIAVTNCAFEENSAIGIGGAVNNYMSTIEVLNCTFANNTASNGASMYTENAPEGCLIMGGPAGGGSISCSYAFAGPVIRNSIFWGDAASTVSQISKYNSDPLVTYSNVQGGFAGTGNIDADPLFKADSLELQVLSPCIDTGNTDALPADAADLDGDGDLEERIPFGLEKINRVMGMAVDMGAYESPPDAD